MTIVVGVDGSRMSAKALSWAADEARFRANTVRVVVLSASSLPFVSPAPLLPIQALSQKASEIPRGVQQLIEDVFNEVPYESVAVDVLPSGRLLLRHVEDAELLVLGLRRVARLETMVMLRRWNSTRSANKRCPMVVF
jgi:nucleotide-binding universal stress UspA family protein